MSARPVPEPVERLREIRVAAMPSGPAMTRRTGLSGLLTAFNAAGGRVDLLGGDLQLAGPREMLGEMRVARFDLLDFVDGQECVLCGRAVDRSGAPGRVLNLSWGKHHGCQDELSARTAEPVPPGIKRALSRNSP